MTIDRYNRINGVSLLFRCGTRIMAVYEPSKLGVGVRVPCTAQNNFYMYSLKEYPEDFTRSRSKQWRKFKKRIKKVAHTQLRRGNEKYEYHGREIAW